MEAGLTIQFIRNYTVEPIGEALQESAQQLGLKVETTFGAYDNLGVEVAALAAGTPPSLAIISIDLDYFSGGMFSPKWNQAEVIAEFNSLLAAIDSVPAATFVLISNFIPSFRPPLPLAAGHPVLGRDNATHELNHLLREFIAQRPNRCGLIDFERIAARLGEAATVDRRFGLMMKSPFRSEFAAAAAGEIARFLRCRLLPPKKVLVLDCDNTLWGGVVGEVGVEGIQLDPYEYPGIAFYRFQSEVLAIAAKGFLICLASKNDEASVWQVLDSHPHCLLRRDTIAAWRIDWADKATNLQELAQELNLGLDSFVFVDDNPAECALVRSALPEVTVIQVPKKIYDFPGTLSATGLFDTLTVNADDASRVQYYQAERGRRDLQTRHVDVDGFLRDLEMKAVVRPLTTGELSRAAQLCQRTNQFNLTTRRYTEADLAALMAGPDARIFLLEAADRFGHMGHSGLIILKRAAGAIEVDTFLMSCRIIGRKFDHALFCHAIKLAQTAWNLDTVRTAYIATRKNSIVASLWKDYGFSPVSEGDAGTFTGRISDLKVKFPDVIQLVDTL